MGEAIPSDPVQEQPKEQAVEQDAEQAVKAFEEMFRKLAKGGI